MSHKAWAEKIPRETRNRLWKNRPHICGICGLEIASKDDMNIDHIVPRSKGGSDDESNLQLSHALCNRLKGDKTSYTIRMQPVNGRKQRLNVEDAILFCKACSAFKRVLFGGRASVDSYTWFGFRNGKKFFGYPAEEIKDALLKAGDVFCYVDTAELTFIKYLLKEGLAPFAGYEPPRKRGVVFFAAAPFIFAEHLTRIHYKSKP